MTDTFFHGIIVSEPVDGVRPILEKSTAVIGVVVTGTAGAGAATEALDAAFPFDRPRRVSDLRAAAALATGGTMANALNAIADQGTPETIVVRVAIGADDAETEENLVGGYVDGAYTGLQALLAAEAVTGIRPRIIGVPGLDTQPVVEAAVIVARKLRGFVYASCRGAETDDIEGACIYRAEFSDRELMLVWPDFTGFDGQAIAAMLGLRAMLDEQVGWHRSISNNALAGVTGISKDVHFDLRDPSTDAGTLNAAQITTLIRMNGYRPWGNRTTSDEPAFGFEVATRTAQALSDIIADVETPFVDRPMTAGLVRDMLESGNRALRRERIAGHIIGGKMWFDGAPNPAERLAAGKLTLDYDYTADAPMEGLDMNQRITSKYYEGFADQIATATG